MVLNRIDTLKNAVLLDYIDTVKNNRLQKTVYEEGSIDYNYWPNQNPTLESYYLLYDSLEVLLSFTYSKSISSVNYTYYPDGRLLYYSFSVEDTTKRNFTLSEESYFIEYHPNGVIRNKYYYLKDVQEYRSYYDNGKIQVRGNFVASGLVFSGKYREYDKDGKPMIKGQYELTWTGCLAESKKIGTWKYYQNGKLIKKEKF
ncbi:toxin-antitoxin system YwqK family antitoxin [Fluviicola sp.]|uniref:toxin-antitoxin system YwqK family antitoxin n=1 Tax=Fluviicola sp. TaxID=1917219 RepID=UPI003D2888F3